MHLYKRDTVVCLHTSPSRRDLIGECDPLLLIWFEMHFGLGCKDCAVSYTLPFAVLSHSCGIAMETKISIRKLLSVRQLVWDAGDYVFRMAGRSIL